MKTGHMRALPVAAVLAAGLAAPAAAATITGTNGPDVLVGTRNADTIRGLDGADKVYGKAGNDRLYSGWDRQRDVIYGGAGNDRIYATLKDVVWAGPGNDVIVLRRGPQPAHTRHGPDLVRVNCGPGYDRLTGKGLSIWNLAGIPAPAAWDCERW